MGAARLALGRLRGQGLSMALLFGGATSDRVDCGSGASLDALATFTALVWVYPTTITATRTIIGKVRGATNEGWMVTVRASGGVQFEHARASAYMVYDSSSTPLAVNTWCFLAATEDQGAGTPGHVYAGTLASAAAEVSYSTATAGSGAWGSDAARSLFIGNRDVASPASAFQGRIATAAIFSRVLTLAEIRQWQLHPTPLLTGCVGFWELGVAGSGTATQPDLSGNGNTGTPTGTSLAAHVPVPTSRSMDPFAALQRAGSW